MGLLLVQAVVLLATTFASPASAQPGRFTFRRDDGSLWGVDFSGAGIEDIPLAVDTNGDGKQELAVYDARDPLAPTPPRAPLRDRLGPGEMLTPGQTLASPDGRYVLMMQPEDGNLVLRAPGNKPIWDSGTAGNPGTVLIMQPEDGNLVLRAPGNRPIWDSATAGNPGTVLIMQNDGVAVVYAPGNRATWATPPPLPAPAPVRDRLGPGEMLTPGQILVSPDGRHVLVMQDDGNLVLRAPANRPIWDSHTARNPGAVLMMQSGDGNLVVRAPGNRPVWDSHTAGNPGTVLILQNDGRAVLYAPGNRAIWVAPPEPPPPSPRAPVRGKVNLCVEINLLDGCWQFATDKSWLGDTPLDNDRASSVSVPDGSRVALFQHADYEGACVDYGPGTHNIGAPVGNDAASSIWVGRRCPPPQVPAVVKLCSDVDLRGDCSEFSTDDGWLGDDRVQNDRASSILVPAGSRAAVFLHANYEGRCNEYGPGRVNIGPPVGNDEASSIWVGRGCTGAARDVRVSMTGHGSDRSATVTWTPPRRGFDQVTNYSIRIDGNGLDGEKVSLRAVSSNVTSVAFPVAGTRLVQATVWANDANGWQSAPARSELSRGQLKVQADHLMRTDLGSFHQYKLEQQALPRKYQLPLDWSDDSCSGPTAPWIDMIFDHACERHDFGYRNFGKGLKLERTQDRKDMIDDVLRDDAYRTCGEMPLGTSDFTHCREMAEAIPWAVRNFADSAFFG